MRIKKIRVIFISFDNQHCMSFIQTPVWWNLLVRIPRSRITKTLAMLESYLLISFASITCVPIVWRMRFNCNHFKNYETQLVFTHADRQTVGVVRNQMNWNWNEMKILNAFHCYWQNSYPNDCFSWSFLCIQCSWNKRGTKMFWYWWCRGANGIFILLVRGRTESSEFRWVFVKQCELCVHVDCNALRPHYPI